MIGSTADRNPFERLAEEFAERLRRGEHPAITDYIAHHPEHADDIRDLFPEIALVEQCKPRRRRIRGLVSIGDPSAATAASPSSWATTASSAISAQAEWAWSTRRCASRFATTSRSR